jgi:hypothetical protein
MHAQSSWSILVSDMKGCIYNRIGLLTRVYRQETGTDGWSLLWGCLTLLLTTRCPGIEWITCQDVEIKRSSLLRRLLLGLQMMITVIMSKQHGPGLMNCTECNKTYLPHITSSHH